MFGYEKKIHLKIWRMIKQLEVFTPMLKRMRELLKSSEEFGMADRIDLLGFQIFAEIVLQWEKQNSPIGQMDRRIFQAALYLRLHFLEEIDLTQLGGCRISDPGSHALRTADGRSSQTSCGDRSFHHGDRIASALSFLCMVLRRIQEEKRTERARLSQEIPSSRPLIPICSRYARGCALL